MVLSAVLGCHCGDGDVQHWSGVSLIRWFVFGNRKRHPAPTEHTIVRVAFFEAKSMLPLIANPVLVRDPDISVCRNCAASSGNLRKLHLSKFVPVPPRRKLVQTEKWLGITKKEPWQKSTVLWHSSWQISYVTPLVVLMNTKPPEKNFIHSFRNRLSWTPFSGRSYRIKWWKWFLLVSQNRSLNLCWEFMLSTLFLWGFSFSWTLSLPFVCGWVLVHDPR